MFKHSLNTVLILDGCEDEEEEGSDIIVKALEELDSEEMTKKEN